MQRTSFKKRWLSLLLTLVMVLGLLPNAVFAANTIDITVEKEGLKQGSYVKVITDTVTAHKTSVSTTYVIDADTDSTIRFTNGTGGSIRKQRMNFLTGQPSKTWSNDEANKTKDITWFLPGIEASAPDLIKAGFLESSFTTGCSKYYFIAITSTKTYGILVQVGKPQEAGSVNKDILNAEIAKVTGDNTTNWYQDNDRYNGKEISSNGFWADMQTVLSNAQEVTESAASSQNTVDEATTALQTAIANLIPTTQVNPTKLYEMLNNTQYLYWGARDGVPHAEIGSENFVGEFIKQNEVSTVTWSPLQTAVTEGQLLMDSLYNSDGSPTEKNDSSDQTLVSQVSDAATAIEAAIKNLDQRTNDAGVADSRLALQSIDLYANTLYNLADLTEANYTPESWTAFINARNTALAVLETGKTFDGMGQRIVRAQEEALKQLRQGCYGLVEKADAITVHFSAVDNYALHEKKESMAVNTCDLELTEDRTIKAALEKAGVTLSTAEKINSSVGIYLNDVYLTQHYNVNINAPALWDAYYSSYQLRDGDELTAVLIAPPLETNLSDTTAAKKMSAVGEYLRYQTIQVADGAKEAGAGFNITVTADGALATNRTGAASPVSGAAVYASEVCQTEAEARTAPITIDTGAVTDANGAANVRLYAEGWYALNVFDLTENGSLTNGQSVLVQVGAAANADAVKADLKSELISLAAAHPENFYTAEQWETIQTAKDTGLAAIDAAGTTSDAYTAKQTAMDTIQGVQSTAAAENKRNLESFRFYLNSLPSDLSKLDQSAKDAVDGVIRCYGAMTGYQREQLTQLEINTYEEIKAINTEGLPAAVSYQLGVAYDLSGVPEADRETLQAMLTYLKENTGNEGKNSGDLGGEKMAELYSFNTTQNSASMGGTVFTPITSAYGCTSVTFCVSPEYATHALIRGNRKTYDRNGNEYGTTLKEEDYTLQGDNWSIRDTSTAEVTSTTFVLNSSRIYTVNGNSYEMRGITVEGLDESSLTNWKYGFFDFSDYLGKHPGNQTFISIADSFRNFVMPYNNVTFTVHWVPTDGTTEEITSAKTSAKSAVEATFGSYSESDYSPENWAALTRAKTDGLAAIDDAASVDAVKNARQAALAAMAAVKVNKSGEIGPAVDLPDYGATVGRVYVTIENNTFPGGAFTGTILSGWYELCEKDTMMTSILKALKTEGYDWTGTGGSGYGITYLASISKDGKKLGEFDGEPGSGWMGMLNDWFTSEGFTSFGVESGKLENGDIINVVYTQNLGVDVGGSWDNSDTSLDALEITGGTLTPGFNGDTLTYSLTIPGDRANVTVTPTAANKNYLVKTFLNTYNSDAAFYKRTENISVKSGDTIYVGVGEKSWPSMNKQGAEAREYTGTKYTIHVYSGGKDGVQAQINALPDAGRIKITNFKSYQSTVSDVRKAYDALGDKSGITITKLTAAEEKIAFFSEIDNVKSLLAAIPTKDKLTTGHKAQVEAARAAYNKLSKDQQSYITISDVKKYNEAVKWLEAQGIETSGGGSISGSAEPVKPEVEVKDGEAKLELDKKAAQDLVDSAKSDKTDTVIIQPDLAEEADKVAVELPKSAVDDLAKNTDAGITLKTDVGNVTVPAEALKDLQGQKGKNVGISAENVKDKDGKPTGETRVELTVDGKAVEQVPGGLSVSIPAKDPTAGTVVVIVDENGKETVLRKSVAEGGNMLATLPGSATVKVVDKSGSFDDSKQHWGKDAIAFVSARNLFNGVGEGTFAPNLPMNRAMLATVLWRLEDESTAKAANSFADVNQGQWYTDAISWAAENKIVNGTGAGFAPDAPITRQQLATMMFRYADLMGLDTDTADKMDEFNDKTLIDSWAGDAMGWAVGVGLIGGKDDGMLHPTGNATRAEVATILQRMVVLMTK